jgi:hypothetical protein
MQPTGQPAYRPTPMGRPDIARIKRDAETCATRVSSARSVSSTGVTVSAAWIW